VSSEKPIRNLVCGYPKIFKPGKLHGWGFPRIADELAGKSIDNEFARSREAQD